MSTQDDPNDEISTSVDLETIYNAICSGIREILASAKSVEPWPEIRQRLMLPCVLIELDELEPGSDPGTGETAVIGRFQARIVVDTRQEKAHRHASVLAAQLVTALRVQDWGLCIEPAQFVQSTQDYTRDELDGHIVWLVEWTHEFCLGQTDWPFEDSTGLSFYLGFDPETGPGNEDKYWPIDQPPQDGL